MQKLLICLACIASLQLVACSSSEQRDNTQKNSFLERIPIVHRPDIQQGNIVTQAMVDQLRPGMSKRQVRFVLGTPMLVDVFHQNRWDYMYTMTEGWGDTKKQRLSLYFEEDRLTRLEGDLRPSQAGVVPEVGKETVVEVPNYQDPNRGIITRAVETVTGVWEGDGKPPAQTATPIDPDDRAEIPADKESATPEDDHRP